MATDSPPDDVRFARTSLLSVLPRRAAVRGPRHLPHVLRALNPLHPQAPPEPLSGGQVGDENRDGRPKCLLLLSGQFCELAVELRELLERGQLSAQRPARLDSSAAGIASSAERKSSSES